MNENFFDVGERIQKKLAELKMKQIEASRKMNMSKTSLNNYISGNRLPDTEALYKLAKLLNVTMEWLLTGEGCGPDEREDFKEQTKEPQKMETETNNELLSIDMLTHGARVRLMRKIHNLTLERLADDLDISIHYLMSVEDNEAELTEIFIERFCKRFNVERDWIETGGSGLYKLQFITASNEKHSHLNSAIDKLKQLPPQDQDEVIMIIDLKYGRYEGHKKKKDSQICGHGKEAANKYYDKNFA